MPDGPPGPAATTVSDDVAVLARLRAGDEAAFAELIDRYNAALLRTAQTFVHDRAVAEDVVQEAWIGLLESLDRFEGRASLKTWIFRILINCARARLRKEGRTVPFSSLFEEEESDEPAVPGRRFFPGWFPRVGGHWREPPQPWEGSPEEQALSAETRSCIERAVAGLPAVQRGVITLRDVEGLPAEEVCNLLDLSDTNQRVLLHRARSKVRRALEEHFREAGGR
ncbi:MAG: sigma-70 family RNA polymerase sigma factor [Dehalococcoidia bacterium]